MIDAFPADYLDRLAAHRGVGDLAPADAAGEVGSVVGASGVRVTLRFAKDASAGRRIAAARFRPFASPAPLAPGSVLVERLVGLDDAAALALSPDDLLRGFGPALPPPVFRAAAHLLEALSKALTDPAAADVAKVSAPGVLVCRCLGVGDRVIRRAIRGGACDVPAIGQVTSAGHGCHSCWPDLRALLDEETQAETRRGEGVRGSDLGRTAPATRAIAAIVRPLWRAQGVTLGSVATDGDVVRLSVASVEKGALASEIGAVAMARHALREVFGEAVRVELARHAGEGVARGPHVSPDAARFPE